MTVEGDTVRADGPKAIVLQDVSKAYPGVKALDEVSFSLKRHSVLGLVGENGAGKSTLLSIINGSVRPDSGTLSIDGHPVRFGHPTEAARHGVATVFQEQGLIATIPVYENIFLGRERKFLAGAGFLRQRAMITEAKAVLDDLHVDVDPRAPTGSLSFGQRQLVEIAKAFALSRVYPVEPIILLDEPTSALSDPETVKLFEGIARWRTRASFVFVSHRLADIFATCDEFVALKDGRVVDQRSTTGIDESALHELIVGRQRNAEYYREASQRLPEDEVALQAVGISKPGELKNVSFDLRKGEILGVAGVLGSGKSTLAKIVAGAEAQAEGEVRIGDALRPGSRRDAIARGIGYVPAERLIAGVIGSDTVEWNLTLPSLDALSLRGLPLLSSRRSRDQTKIWMEKLRVRAPSHDTPCRNLSGGNQQKVVFAKWLARGTHILVLDDPGRGLDVGAKEDIYRLMREIVANEGSILLVSDNLPELIGLSNRILVLRDGAMSALIGAEQGAKPREAEVVAAMV
jgi:ribose transport system ATP-binding protein